MLLESDSSWLTLAGPYPMLPRLSAPVSGVDCPCPFFHANSLLSSRQLPSAGSRRQLPFASPYHFRIRRDFMSKNPLSVFAPKQTIESSALAAQPHSASYTYSGWIPVSKHRKMESTWTHIKTRYRWFKRENSIATQRGKPRQQCLVYWKWCYFTSSEDVLLICYWLYGSPIYPIK